MRILLVSVLFAPNNEIGAIRPTKIAGHLAERGHWVDIVTYGGNRDDSFLIPPKIHKIYHMMPYAAIKKKEHTENAVFHKSSRIVDSMKRLYRGMLSEKNGDEFVKYFTQLFDTELKNLSYDVLITSFGPLASLKCGIYVKKHLPKINWICDFRDPVVGGYTPPLLYGHWKSVQDKACRMADEIVAVSNGYIKSICGNKYKQKRYMIPNGYDSSEYIEEGDRPSETDSLTLVYAGALYEGKRDLSILFKAIAELQEEKKISDDKIVFKYAGNDFEILKEQAKKYNVANILTDYGRLSRSDCLKFQKDAHILILATWNTKKDQGIFPGKFLEYMLIGKPIISITVGDLYNGEVSNVIREGHLGIAYESAKDSTDYELLKNYISEQYDHFIKSGCIEYEPIQDVIDRYDYRNIMPQIEKLL